MGHSKLVTTDTSKHHPEFLKNVKTLFSDAAGKNPPIVIRMHEKNAAEQLKSLTEKHAITEVIDNYAEQYAELLLSKNAHLYRANHTVQIASIEKLLDEHYGENEPWTLGSWVYFPWNGQLIHILTQPDFEDLRTIRNRDLITSEEQKLLADFPIACFGMSVGSAGALAATISGMSRNIKLIDGAVISGSNLNRILTGVASVGKSKSVIIGQQIYEMNPYSIVEHIEKATPHNVGDIFDKPWPIKLAIDEIDDIEMKIRIRIEARKRRVPVVMATELGDTIMIDVERFDTEPKRQLFHGAIPGIESLIDKQMENHREWMKHAVRIIDPKNMPIRMQESLLKIGSTIVTHPQLGSTVMQTGGALAFAVKNIALNNALESGRYVISLENIMLADHGNRKLKKKHKKHTKIIDSAIKSM